MKYTPDFSDEIKRKLKKLKKKDINQLHIIEKKMEEILENPHAFKPLKWPMVHKRRVQIGHFVLTYSIYENEKAVKFLDYEHHDKAYKMS
ncbi:MAG: type II toxin-antitoxin system RelE/ParE family toxin [Candidatus Micrarchaeota archaeon]